MEAKTEAVKKILPNGGYPMHTFQDVKDIYFTYITNPNDRKMIENAYLLASKKHAGVLRKSGEPYIQHPIEVAYILSTLQSGPETIAAGFLHDVVEDTDETIPQIEASFGHDVAFLVDSLTKIQRMKLSHRSESDFEAEDHRKIFLGMAKDVRVIIIKLADRLHNMRTLDALTPDRQKALAKETLEVFTPIAHRLGIYTIQSELEDLSLKYIEPEKYNQILNLLNEKEKNRQESLESLKKRIADILFEKQIPFRIESRVKSIYSIYRKMYLKGKDFEEIYDVLAVRIITKSEMNCYEILGIIHATYKPVPGRFKDYIAMPKPNMYQSLHTTIIAGDGNIYEVQIRTEEMDSVAEEGVAAHWRYKEGEAYNAKEQQRDIEEKLHWFRDFVSMGEESGDAKSYMAALSNDIFNANVYVFTPLGKVIDLPQGATTLDFAYKIHTKVGDSATGAIVNGSFVPLNTVLKTGDVCEIKTSKNTAGPNEGWLDIVKTASAKAHIKKALNAKNEHFMADENIKRGKESCLDSFKMQGIGEGEMEKYLNDNKVFNEYHVKDLDDLYAAIGNKNPVPANIIDFLGIKKKKPSSLKASRHNDNQNSAYPVYVNGITNIAVTLAKCCSPVPGDDIVGYITRGKGVTVHRVNCPNVANEKKRLIPVYWKDDLGISTYPVDIEIYANDRPGLLADILSSLSSRSIAVSDLQAHLVTQTMNDVVSLTIYVSDAKVIEDAFSDLASIKGVYNCERVIH